MKTVSRLVGRAGSSAKHQDRQEMTAGDMGNQESWIPSHQHCTSHHGYTNSSLVSLVTIFLWMQTLIKERTSCFWIDSLFWKRNIYCLWQSRKPKFSLVNKQAQACLPQHTGLKYFTELHNGTKCSQSYKKLLKYVFSSLSFCILSMDAWLLI